MVYKREIYLPMPRIGQFSLGVAQLRGGGETGGRRINNFSTIKRYPCPSQRDRCFRECNRLRRVTFGLSSCFEWSGVEEVSIPKGVRELWSLLQRESLLMSNEARPWGAEEPRNWADFSGNCPEAPAQLI